MSDELDAPRVGIDYRELYQSLPAGIAVLNRRLEYVDTNRAYLRMSGRRRSDLIGNFMFEVFPENPADPGATGSRDIGASLRHVMATGEKHIMGLQRYDIELPDRPGVFEERYWSIINIPLFTDPRHVRDGDEDGHDGPGAHGDDEGGRTAAMVVHRVEEVTAFIQRARGGGGGRIEAELYMRARELQEINERLRRAHAHEREVALALQAAMLPAPRPVGHRFAVRYHPAAGTLNVCGDWYDLVDLPGGQIAVAVGDVVGHGLGAACVMGQLRSALSAASRVTRGPAEALDALGLYARSVEGAESTTVVTTYIDWPRRSLTYSSAGHPPAALLHPDGTVQFLDRATDPPLGARPEHQPRPQATTRFTAGATLILYTDGLVERRHEDIDVGLTRLARSLTRHRGADPETMADALLAELIPASGATDDTALVVIRL